MIHKHRPCGTVCEALSHFPELRKEQIEFKFRKSPFAHTSAVEVETILFPWQRREYCITISTELPGRLANTLFASLPAEAQVGVLGHELAHTADYRRRSNLGLFLMGIKYQFVDLKKEIELKTDLRALQHGLGCQLLAWSEAVHVFLAEDGWGELYLSPLQIKGMMGDSPENDAAQSPTFEFEF